jgi:23S rRNA pseudouridine2457 synthase
MLNSKYKYFLLNKPYGVLSQFTDKDKRLTLSSVYNFPANVYPVGRLDMDSEGILLVTNNKSLTDNLLNPKKKHEREYYVQIEGIPSQEALQKLRQGIKLKEGKTLPAKVKLIDDPKFPVRVPPIRERKNIPVSWISITLTEGRNRQVRRMTAAAGYPTLRLIRVRMKNLLIGNLQPGEVRELNEDEIKKLLN